MIKNKWIEKIYADYASTYFHLCQQHYPHFQTRYFCHECGTKIASFFHAMIWDIHIWRIKIYIFSFQLWETSVFPASVFSYFLSNPEDLFLLFSVADEKFINFLSHPNVYTIFYTLWKNVDIYLQLKILLLIFFPQLHGAVLNWIKPEELHLAVKYENNDDTSGKHFVSSRCLKNSFVNPLEATERKWCIEITETHTRKVH